MGSMDLKLSHHRASALGLTLVQAMVLLYVSRVLHRVGYGIAGKIDRLQ